MGKDRKAENPAPEEEQNNTALQEGDEDDNQDIDPTEVAKLFKDGKLLTKDRVNEIVEERLARQKEADRANAEKERADAEAAATRKALKDQENYKELSESQATELANKDQEISTLKEQHKRISVLEDRLTNIVDAQTEALAPAFKALLGKMTVEERAEWVESNPELVNGTPDGSPPTPKDDRGRIDRSRREEAERKAREDMQRGQHSRI